MTLSGVQESIAMLTLYPLLANLYARMDTPHSHTLSHEYATRVELLK